MTEPTTEDIRRLESRVAVLEMICSLIINSLDRSSRATIISAIDRGLADITGFPLSELSNLLQEHRACLIRD